MKDKAFIDLHMHTRHSDDGEFTPSNLVEQCHEAGIAIMAVTDHNSVKGIDEALVKAQSLGIRMIPGIEIDCTYHGINLHVLGYGIDHTNLVFNQLEDNILIQELRSSAAKLRLTNALGFDLSESQLRKISSTGIYTGEMFAEVLLDDPRYFDHPILSPYRKGGSRSANPYVNFYWDYYAQGKPCYTPIEYPSLEKVLAIIKDTGGISVLAHPGNNLKGNFGVFDDMIRLGIQGVEAFSSYHSEETNRYFYEKARKEKLLFTCGSDYHGKTKPSIRLNQTGCFIDQHEILERLQASNLV